MIKKARASLDRLENLSLEVADVVEYEFSKTDLVVAYYCLQFVAPKFRQAAVDKIYNALEWGGCIHMV